MYDNIYEFLLDKNALPQTCYKYLLILLYVTSLASLLSRYWPSLSMLSVSADSSNATTMEDCVTRDTIPEQISLELLDDEPHVETPTISPKNTNNYC